MQTVMETKGLRFSTFIELLLLSDGPLQTSETRLISENLNGGKYRILISTDSYFSQILLKW